MSLEGRVSSSRPHSDNPVYQELSKRVEVLNTMDTAMAWRGTNHDSGTGASNGKRLFQSASRFRPVAWRSTHGTALFRSRRRGTRRNCETTVHCGKNDGGQPQGVLRAHPEHTSHT